MAAGDPAARKRAFADAFAMADETGAGDRAGTRAGWRAALRPLAPLTALVGGLYRRCHDALATLVPRPPLGLWRRIEPGRETKRARTADRANLFDAALTTAQRSGRGAGADADAAKRDRADQFVARLQRRQREDAAAAAPGAVPRWPTAPATALATAPATAPATPALPAVPATPAPAPAPFPLSASAVPSTPAGRVSVHPSAYGATTGRVAKYRSPFAGAGAVASAPRARGFAVDAIQQTLAASPLRSSPGLLATLSARSPGATPGRSPRPQAGSPAAPATSIADLLRQLVSEGDATDFPSWNAILDRRKARIAAIERMKHVQPEEEPIEALTPAQAARVDEAVRGRDVGRALVSKFRIDVSVRDLRTLGPRQWLNDNVIDFYLEMVTERSRQAGHKYPRSFSYSTHFYTTLSGKGYAGVARWARRKKLDLAQTDLVFVPINVHGSHWCVGVINLRARRLEYYDSLGGGPGRAFACLREYVAHEARAQGVDAGDAAAWAEHVPNDSPMQENGFDCGVFTCKTVEVLSRGRPLTFSQRDMDKLRRRMAFEILEARLLTA
ncbi:uncharacterized protein V1510DRAFT_431009 [Dipodascopsis tothii]|uniref:uncharacterized protein n=1 Tax=Dipodascopsis tothii TaxID=44089 RepID=UPI0034CFF815